MFLLAIDWDTKTCPAQRQNGIQWTFSSPLDDLDFAGLALLSDTHHQVQEKSEVVKVNAVSDTLITLEGELLKEVESSLVAS